MPKSLRKLKNELTKHLDFYALIFSFFGLVFLGNAFPEIFNNNIWLGQIISGLLMCLAIAGIRDRKKMEIFKKLIKKDDGDNVTWYFERREATPAMQSDMEQFSHMIFVGISNERLNTIFSDVIGNFNGKELPWKSIDIYFASNSVGEVYEPREFKDNLGKSRHRIAAVITDPANASKLKGLDQVCFYQLQEVAEITGSVFANNKDRPSVIYAVYSTALKDSDTRKGHTIRLTKSLEPDVTTPKFNSYVTKFRSVFTRDNMPISLGQFSRSVWDASAMQWSEYARQSKVLIQSAKKLSNLMILQDEDSVLEIGAGSGETAKEILGLHPNIHLTVLDGSPQMVRLLRGKFKGQEKVSVALCALPAKDTSDVDLRYEKFSCIVTHQTLGDIQDAFGNMDLFAAWCRERLERGGQVIIAAHNSVVETTDDPTWPDWEAKWKNWDDPFRKKLNDIIDNRYNGQTRGNAPKLKKDDVKKAFERHGFSHDKVKEERIELDYEERRRLWHVPAVMNSLLDVTNPNNDGIYKEVDEIANSLKGEETKPRTVVFWRFVLNHESAQAKENTG